MTPAPPTPTGDPMSTIALILAAGLGKRMKSALPKVLHPILGDPSLLWVLRALPASVAAAVVVVHHGQEQVEAALAAWTAQGLLPCPATTVDQGEPLGTGHAAPAGRRGLDRLGATRVVILCGDVPLIRAATVARLAQSRRPAAGHGPGRPLRLRPGGAAADGTLEAVVEHKDASPERARPGPGNGGAYALPWGPLKEALAAALQRPTPRASTTSPTRSWTWPAGCPVAVELCDPAELLGMNSRAGPGPAPGPRPGPDQRPLDGRRA